MSALRIKPDQALAAFTSAGPTIAQLSERQPVLLVFLRHFGCTFCREALTDLSVRRRSLAQRGVQIVLVHMADLRTGEDMLARYGLSGLPHVSDPQKEVYTAFGLTRGSFAQLFGLKCLWRGILATLRGHFVGKLVGDGFQMPGAFLINHGRVERSFCHRSAADRPDYDALACPLPPAA